MRHLVLSEDGKELFSCPVMLGKEPKGHKKCEDDGRTPEGLYYVCTKNAESRFHLALGISYPNIGDAQDALREGLIDNAAYDRIAEAQHSCKRPPWDTPMGGYIMLHGEHPAGKAGDWTAGCIAVSNADIEILFAHAQYGMDIEIKP